MATLLLAMHVWRNMNLRFERTRCSLDQSHPNQRWVIKAPHSICDFISSLPHKHIDSLRICSTGKLNESKYIAWGPRHLQPGLIIDKRCKYHLRIIDSQYKQNYMFIVCKITNQRNNDKNKNTMPPPTTKFWLGRGNPMTSNWCIFSKWADLQLFNVMVWIPCLTLR